LSVESASRELMREMILRGDMDELPKERLTDEIRKLLKAAKPSVGLELMRELTLVKRDYPELHAQIGVEQEKEWHPEGDVWTHTLMVMDEAAKIIPQSGRKLSEEEQMVVMLGCLCHDLGKPATTGVKDGRIRSHGHEEAGKDPTKSLLAKWKFSEEIIRGVLHIVLQHLKPGMHYLALQKETITEEQYTNNVRKLLKRIHPTSWRVLVAAAEADWRGRAIVGADTVPYDAGNYFIKTVLENKFDEAPKKTMITGADIRELGLSPGPRYTELIQAVEAERDLGHITTREEALIYLRSLI